MIGSGGVSTTRRQICAAIGDTRRIDESGWLFTRLSLFRFAIHATGSRIHLA
jgi:hypothetical protein